MVKTISEVGALELFEVWSECDARIYASMYGRLMLEGEADRAIISLRGYLLLLLVINFSFNSIRFPTTQRRADVDLALVRAV